MKYFSDQKLKDLTLQRTWLRKENMNIVISKIATS